MPVKTLRNPSKMAITALMLFIIMAQTVKEFRKAYKYSDTVSSIADGFSESNAIRAGESYADKGFLANYGLPDLNYGYQVREFGAAKPREPGVLRIYTHYPPGPDWMAGIMTEVCSPGNYFCYRTLPVSIGLLASLFLVYTLLQLFSPLRSLLLLGFMVSVPLYSNMMHGIHYQGYALSLLVMQLCFYMLFFAGKIVKLRNFYLALFLLSFVQGWLSFDFFFLASFSGIPFLLFHHSWEEVKKRKDLWLLVFIPPVGFSLAHAIHFLQVILYYGDFLEAFNDLFRAAATKFNNSMEKLSWLKSRDINPLVLINRYLARFAQEGKMFNFSLRPFVILSFALFWSRSFSLNIHHPTKMKLTWSSSKRALIAVFVAFCVSFLWIVVMRQHAATHPHFIPRHLYFFYFFVFYGLAMQLKTQKEQ